MNIKSAIIKTNDVLAYLAFAAVLVVGVMTMINGNAGLGMLVLLIGWIACSLVFGFWFCLSDMADSLRAIAEKQ